MTKYLPFIVVGIVLVPLTMYQWRLMDWVWGANLPAMQCAYLLETEVPMEFGNWVGEDQAVDQKILQVAGADGYVNRVYTNTKTNEQVSIWFIVGHFRQVSRHTPNFCYKTAGFEQVEPESLVPMAEEGQDEGDKPSIFRTAKFSDEGQFRRVFWAWWRPDPLEEGKTPADVNIRWSAPEQPRIEFGYCRALYKLYFTAASTPEELPDESVCLRFAAEFLPIINKSLTESGVVMVSDELPADHEQVFQRMHDKTEGLGVEAPVEETEPATADPVSAEAA